MTNITTGQFTSANPDLTVIDGVIYTTSLQIAQYFNKPHNLVLRAIRNIIAMLSGAPLCNFAQGYYTLPETGDQQHTMYRVTRYGFSLLGMGFTGKEAFKWKVLFLDTFERMEAELLNNAKQLPPSTGLDARTLLLTGQSDAVPMPDNINKAIDKAAWRMAGEAYELLRKHLARRVAFHHVNGYRSHPNVMQAEALSDLRTVKLGHALTHTAQTELRHTLSMIRSARDNAQNSVEAVELQLEKLEKAHLSRPTERT